MDCFSGRDKGLLFSGARERLRMRNGIAVSTQLIDDLRFEDLTKKISDALGIYGDWFFQVKEDINHQLTLLGLAQELRVQWQQIELEGLISPC